jgi:hypothetical protein
MQVAQCLLGILDDVPVTLSAGSREKGLLHVPPRFGRALDDVPGEPVRQLERRGYFTRASTAWKHPAGITCRAG